jgi:ribosome maturation factor RimP
MADEMDATFVNLEKKLDTKLEARLEDLKREMQKSIGEEVEVKLYKPVNKKKEFVGILTAFDQATITIEFEDHTTMVIPRTDAAMVRLTFDF